MKDRLTTTLRPTSPLWGGRPSERARAKKVGWGVRSLHAKIDRRLDRSPHRARFGANAQEARRPPHKGEVNLSASLRCQRAIAARRNCFAAEPSARIGQAGGLRGSVNWNTAPRGVFALAHNFPPW